MSVDATFNGIATLLNQLGQNRRAVKNEFAVGPPATLAKAAATSTNPEDFIEAAAMAAGSARPTMAVVLATPLLVETGEGAHGDGREARATPR